MQRPTLLKQDQGLELWADHGDAGPVFAVKHHPRKMRMAATLAEAEALFEHMLGQTRQARAH